MRIKYIFIFSGLDCDPVRYEFDECRHDLDNSVDIYVLMVILIFFFLFNLHDVEEELKVDMDRSQ